MATTGGVIRTDSESATVQGGLRAQTDIGTELEVRAEGGLGWRKTSITPAVPMTLSFGPIASASLSLDARQPLLRGAGQDAALAALRLARANYDEAQALRDENASGLLRELLSACWELWYAERAVAVQREALALAEAQARDAEIRATQLSTAAQAELLRFTSELARVRSAVLAAETSRIARALALGRLLGMAPDRARELIASSAPPAELELPALGPLLADGTAASSTLRVRAAQLRAANERVIAAADAKQIRLDLKAQLGVSGLWIEDSLPGLALPNDRPAFGGMVGLELELPIGDSREAAEYAQAVAQKDAADARYRDAEVELEASLSELHARIQASTQEVELAREVAKAMGELAEAERKRYSLGATTSTEVVRAQQDHREAELRWLRALVDRSRTALELEQRAGRLLARIAAGRWAVGSAAAGSSATGSSAAGSSTSGSRTRGSR